ncbi:MAG: sulfotransferase [Rikenellaceae bacterium]
MGLIDFNKLPVNTLIGADWKTFCRVTKGMNIEKGYKTKYILTKCICRLLSSFKGLQDSRYDKQLKDIKLEQPPVFILGHWRSGTTFMHNVLSQDKNFGYNTTYQTVMPHLMMWGQGMFKKTTSWVMPDKRPTDNMELNVDQPQEEEFALSNMTPHSYYHLWFFPQLMNYYADKYLLFDTISEEELAEFEEVFTKLIKISLWNTQGKQFLSKNPPHTGRVKELLKMFPDAKFVYLMRNPYTVFESTRSFFSKTIKPLQLQNISEEELEENILTIYEKLYHKYEEDKKLIPEGNLVEIKFEDYEADAYAQTELIYKSLGLTTFDSAKGDIEAYISKKKGHKKTKYNFHERTIKLVEERWGFALEQWGYKL